MIKVILMLDYSSEFDRRLLRGIVRYTKENGQWFFCRIASDHGHLYAENSLKLAAWAKKWKANAIIGRFNEDEIRNLEKLNIPIVLQNYRNRSTVHSNITGDYKGTGEMAARYFYSKRFSSYAFFGLHGVVWSDERLLGYRESVSKYGGLFNSYEIDTSGRENVEAIACWLHGLPDKTALFCCDDAHALMITEICRIEGIEIPKDLAVLGVDNDDLRCSISDPPISSIELGVEQGGYMLCKLLHNQINNPDARHFGVVINPISIRERQSTSSYNVDDPMVVKVLDFINENYTGDISVKDVLDIIPLSRRSIESRFRKSMGLSIYQYALSCRIEKVAQLLVTTDKSLADIASEAGIQDYGSLAGQFRKVKGCTPIEYRAKFCVFSK